MTLVEGNTPRARTAHDRDPQTEAVIDLEAITHNVGILRKFAGDAALMAVIKADGYNHGAAAVAQTALAAGARELGVTTIPEALTLRNAGITAPILTWLNGVDADFVSALDADIEIGVSSPRHLESVVAAARELGRPATVALKVDTGLNRNGVSRADWPQMLTDLGAAHRAGSVRLRSVFSHLAHSDEPHNRVIDLQKQRLIDAVADVRGLDLDPEVVHLSNSAAVLTRPDLRFDMVRPGIALYGLSPVPELGDFGLRPAMTLQARVLLVKKVKAGDGVSYGHTWIAPRDTTVALLPLGYADGLPRILSGRFEVQLGGARRQAVGRICMDQVLVDLGPDGGGVREGDVAIFFGDGSRGEPHAQTWADALDTIHYEIVTGIRGRTVRTFRGGEDPK
ncbi:alanine racemase [Rhodococcus sp. 27YEA15]|uniref:alanine racemase n=1 Tax=Rhodococcus sp. 27YEA15 TaxID=3156259 RepID=UPI003C7A1DDB